MSEQSSFTSAVIQLTEETAQTTINLRDLCEILTRHTHLCFVCETVYTCHCLNPGERLICGNCDWEEESQGG